MAAARKSPLNPHVRAIFSCRLTRRWARMLGFWARAAEIHAAGVIINGENMREILGCAVAALLLVGPAAAQSSYPDRPVRLIVPFAAGGATDVVARLIGSELSKALNQTFVVENKPGASGMIGVDAVAKSKPDGYTLGVSPGTPLVVVPYLDPKSPFRPERDLEFITPVYDAPFILCARSDLPQKTLAAFLAAAKTDTREPSYGTVGIASVNHALHEEMARRSGARMLHVPYTGEAPIMPALMTGQVDIAFITPASATGLIKEGKILGLASGGPGRVAALPDMPTISEVMGWPDYSAHTWTMLVGPKGMPEDVTARLNAATTRILADPEVQSRLAKLGLVAMGGSLADTAAFVRSEAKRFQDIVRLNDIRRE